MLPVLTAHRDLLIERRPVVVLSVDVVRMGHELELAVSARPGGIGKCVTVAGELRPLTAFPVPSTVGDIARGPELPLLAHALVVLVDALLEPMAPTHLSRRDSTDPNCTPP
jgi:hypothetical protein